jgi:hypothetical protein
MVKQQRQSFTLLKRTIQSLISSDNKKILRNQTRGTDDIYMSLVVSMFVGVHAFKDWTPWTKIMKRINLYYTLMNYNHSSPFINKT